MFIICASVLAHTHSEDTSLQTYTTEQNTGQISPKADEIFGKLTPNQARGQQCDVLSQIYTTERF